MFIYTALTGDNMADEDGKTLAEIAEERGIELNEVEMEIQPTEFPEGVVWWSQESLDSAEDGKYDVLTCWPQIVMQDDDHDDVQNFFANMGCKHPVHIVGCIRTLPDYEERHKEKPLSGGRCDLFFYFHTDDIWRVAVRRLMHGIIWWEDIVSNAQDRADNAGLTLEQEMIYPREFLLATGTIEGEEEE